MRLFSFGDIIKLMLDQKTIHNSAILKPNFTRGCAYYRQNGQHADVKTKDGKTQCIECGSIKQGEKRNAIHRYRSN